jgi:hypothetical protein
MVNMCGYSIIIVEYIVIVIRYKYKQMLELAAQLFILLNRE